MTRRIVLAAALAGALAGALALGACADVAGRGDLAWGERLARSNCARCHAIGAEGSSPNAFAPPFRELSKRYPAETLNASFTSHALFGHAPMPNFASARADDLADLLAYVRSVQDPQAGPWPRPGAAPCGPGPCASGGGR
jgi:mono/diheme cytochrome c family protein